MTLHFSYHLSRSWIKIKDNYAGFQPKGQKMTSKLTAGVREIRLFEEKSRQSEKW